MSNDDDDDDDVDVDVSLKPKDLFDEYAITQDDLVVAVKDDGEMKLETITIGAASSEVNINQYVLLLLVIFLFSFNEPKVEITPASFFLLTCMTSSICFNIDMENKRHTLKI